MHKANRCSPNMRIFSKKTHFEDVAKLSRAEENVDRQSEIPESSIVRGKTEEPSIECSLPANSTLDNSARKQKSTIYYTTGKKSRRRRNKLQKNVRSEKSEYEDDCLVRELHRRMCELKMQADDKDDSSYGVDSDEDTECSQTEAPCSLQGTSVDVVEELKRKLNLNSSEEVVFTETSDDLIF